MPKMIFVNLPVRDLQKSIAFYKAIGCEQNMQFSDENAASMAWSDTIVFMLLTHDFFKTFARKPIADATRQTGSLIALSRDSKADVDAIVEAAQAAGGKGDIRETQDMGFMYGRTFEDPDGHVFEPMWMDPAAVEGGAH